MTVSEVVLKTRRLRDVSFPTRVRYYISTTECGDSFTKRLHLVAFSSYTMSLAFRRSGARLSASWMASIPQVLLTSTISLSTS